MAQEFDSARGAFLLVTIIIGTQMVISLMIVGGCMYGRLENILAQDACKNAIGPMMELIQQSFTAAIAFAGGRYTAPRLPEPKLSEEKKDG